MIKEKTRPLPPCSTARLPQGDGYISAEENKFLMSKFKNRQAHTKEKSQSNFFHNEAVPLGKVLPTGAGKGAMFFSYSEAEPQNGIKDAEPLPTPRQARGYRHPVYMTPADSPKRTQSVAAGPSFCDFFAPVREEIGNSCDETPAAEKGWF